MERGRDAALGQWVSRLGAFEAPEQRGLNVTLPRTGHTKRGELL